MRILGIDHIGIASADLGRHIEIFGDKMGLEIHDIHEKDPYGGLRAAFVPCPSAMRRATAAWRSGGGAASSYPGPPSPSPSSRSEERERAVSSPDRAGCAGRC